MLFATLLQNVMPYAAAAGLGPVALRGFAARIAQGFQLKKIDWAIVVCFLYWIASYFWSGGTFQNMTEILFWRRDGLILVTLPIFFCLLAISLRPRVLTVVWVAFVVILGLAGVIGTIVDLNLPHPRFFDSLYLVEYDPGMGQEMFLAWYLAHNTTGGIYSLAALISLALLQERVGKKYSFLAWLVLLACLSGLAFSYSRGAYLGFAAGAAIIFPWKKAGRALKTALLVVVPILLLLLFTSSVLDRIDTISDPYYGTNVSRVTLWEEALEDFKWSPVVGIGFSRYNDEYLKFWGVKGVVWVAVHGQVINLDSHAHNSYFQFLAEGGILGLLISMSIWWFGWEELSFFEQKLPASKLHWLHRASKGCLVGILVMSLTEHMLGEGSVVLSLMSVLGMTLAASRSELAAVESKATKRRTAAERAVLATAQNPTLAGPVR